MNKGNFKPGDTPWNKGLKGVNGTSSTSYKKGPDHTGDKHISWKGGVQKPANDCAHLWNGNGKRIRRPKAIWEHFNKCEMPVGFVIYHLDGDKSNDDPSNLEAISRGELLKRNLKNKNERI